MRDGAEPRNCLDSLSSRSETNGPLSTTVPLRVPDANPNGT